LVPKLQSPLDAHPPLLGEHVLPWSHASSEVMTMGTAKRDVALSRSAEEGGPKVTHCFPLPAHPKGCQAAGSGGFP
jgi:hypothetical protein